VLLGVIVSDVVAFTVWLELGGTVEDEVLIVLEAKVISLLVVMSAVVVAAEEVEVEVCSAGIVLVTTSDDCDELDVVAAATAGVNFVFEAEK
jgi:hypothetical protein